MKPDVHTETYTSRFIDALFAIIQNRKKKTIKCLMNKQITINKYNGTLLSHEKVQTTIFTQQHGCIGKAPRLEKEVKLFQRLHTEFK